MIAVIQPDEQTDMSPETGKQVGLGEWNFARSVRRIGIAKKIPRIRTRIGRQPPQERARWGSLENLSSLMQLKAAHTTHT